jgi:hypothetical protein
MPIALSGERVPFSAVGGSCQSMKKILMGLVTLYTFTGGSRFQR